MDKTEIEQLLDRLGEYQARVDLLNIEKQELLDQVKIPAEVLAVQDETIKRKRAVDAEYQAKQNKLIRQKQELLSTVVIPPEIKAAFDAIEKQRAAIEQEFTRKNSDEWGKACRKKEQIDQELTDGVAEVFAQVEARKRDIVDEFGEKITAADSNINLLKEQIKAAVKGLGATVKGKFWQAVYVKGRVTWNTDMLDGMIVAFPELAKARKEGEPSITMRKV